MVGKHRPGFLVRESGRPDDPICLYEPETERRNLQTSRFTEWTGTAVSTRTTEEEPQSCHSCHAVE
jgi:hypothetical protein